MNKNKIIKALAFKISLLVLFSFFPIDVFAQGSGQIELLLKGLLPGKSEMINITLSKDPDFYAPEGAANYLKENNRYFLEYGLKGLLVTSYYKAGEIITIEIYRLNDYKGAYGAFTFSRVPSEGNIKIGDGSLKSKTSIVFWQNAFLVKLITLGRLQGTVNTMDRIARIISRRIGSHKKTPYYVSYLPQKDLQVNSVKFVTGPAGFKRYFSFFPREFYDKPGNISEGVVANYSGKHKYSYALLQYWSDGKAIEVLDGLLWELKRQSVEHYYLFDVLYYKANYVHYKVDRIDNYISIFAYGEKDFNYDWFLNGIKGKIHG